MWHENEGDSHVFQRRGKSSNAVEFNRSLGDFSKMPAKRKEKALQLLHRPTMNYLKANTESLDQHISKLHAENQAEHDSDAPFSPIRNRGRKGASPSSRRHRDTFNNGKEVRSGEEQSDAWESSCEGISTSTPLRP